MSTSGRGLRFGAALLAVVAAATVASAQRGRQRGFGGGFGRLAEGPGVPARYPPKNFEDGAFSVCKVQYTSVRYEEMGVGWATDYPYAGINLMTRLSELTKTPISRDADGNPNYWVVHLTDDELFRCPFTIASDVGTMGLSDEEASRLGQYLRKGGFLWVDDFWGTPAWTQWSEQIHKALPEFPIVDVPPEHALRHEMFDIPVVKQVTNIQFWRRSGGVTQERGSDSPHADFRMMADEKGRVMVVMTHNTDIGDSWEREGEDHEFFLQFSPAGYSLGMNVLLYAMSH
jgi:Domain of unknown function (DUF4159)